MELPLMVILVLEMELPLMVIMDQKMELPLMVIMDQKMEQAQTKTKVHKAHQQDFRKE